MRYPARLPVPLVSNCYYHHMVPLRYLGVVYWYFDYPFSDFFFSALVRKQSRGHKRYIFLTWADSLSYISKGGKKCSSLDLCLEQL